MSQFQLDSTGTIWNPTDPTGRKFVFECECMYESTCKCVHVCLCVFLFCFVCVCVCWCVLVGWWVGGCVHVHVYCVSLNWYCTHVFAHLCLYVRVCVCVCVIVCEYMCLMCVRVCVWVGVRLFLPETEDSTPKLHYQTEDKIAIEDSPWLQTIANGCKLPTHAYSLGTCML